MEKVRCGVVGLGAIGPLHLAAIENIGNAEVAAVCDTVRERADGYAEMYGCKAYYGIGEMLRDGGLDLVHICVPSGNHAETGIAAARSGRHVLVEKPIDVTLEAADRLIAECDKAGVLLSCISQHRFDDAMLEARDALDRGLFGTLAFGGSHTKWYRSQEYYDSGDWRGTWELDGGGALMNQSVHYVDMLQYMMGEVDEVSAYCATRAHARIEVEDVAAAALRFKNGAVGLLEGNTAAYPGYCTRLDIYGSDGGIVIENDKIRERKFRAEGVDGGGFYGSTSSAGDGAADKSKSGASSAEIATSSHQRQIQDVVDAILTGRPPKVTGRDARHPLAVILAVYESARTGKAVKVK